MRQTINKLLCCFIVGNKLALLIISLLIVVVIALLQASHEHQTTAEYLFVQPQLLQYFYCAFLLLPFSFNQVPSEANQENGERNISAYISEWNSSKYCY